MVDLPAPRRERLSLRLAELARLADKATSLDEIKRSIVPELHRLAVGG